MKTTANFIEELLQRPIAESKITDLTFTMVSMLMKQYAKHVRDEDRKVVAENVVMCRVDYTGKKVDNDNEFSNSSGYSFSTKIDKESILDAPKIELK